MAHRSKLRGLQGISRAWDTDRAARWLVVSRPPASMMTWSYFLLIARTSVRTEAPVSLTQV